MHAQPVINATMWQSQLHPQSSASQSHYMPLFKNSKKKASSVVEGSTQLRPQSSASLRQHAASHHEAHGGAARLLPTPADTGTCQGRARGKGI